MTKSKKFTKLLRKVTWKQRNKLRVIEPKSHKPLNPSILDAYINLLSHHNIKNPSIDSLHKMSTPQLNGAYYGPSIPPPSKPPKSYHRHSRGGGGSCNPFSWCFSCLCGCVFNLIFQILITILVLLGIAVLVLWLIFRPNVPKFHVNDATLTQFTLSQNNNTLYYNLAVNMTFRNPNRRVGIYYDRIEANAEYHGNRFDTKYLDTFYLGHKKERDLSTTFAGNQVVVLGNGDRSRYDGESRDRVYNIDLKLKIRMRLKAGWVKPKFKPKFECDLRVPLTSGGSISNGGFQRTKCDFDW